MQTDLGVRAPRTPHLQKVQLLRFRASLQTVHLRAVPFLLETIGSPAIAGLCLTLVALTRPAFLSCILLDLAPTRRSLILLAALQL